MADIASMIDRADRLCQSQRFGEADRLYADVLKADPRHTGALLQRARLAVGEGRLADARSLLEAILAIEPNHAPACQGLAVVSQRSGDLAQAGIWYARIEQIQPADAAAAYNSAVIQQQLGQLERAESSLRRAIALDPKFAPACNNLGNLLLQQSRYAEAEVAYRQAVIAAPGLVEAHYNLGLVLQKLARADEAERAFRLALQLKPDDPATLFALGSLSQDANDLEQAVLWYRRALAVAPGMIDAHFNLGTALRDLRHLEPALTEFRQALALGLAGGGLARFAQIPPSLSGAYFEIAGLLRQMDDIEGWIAHFNACPVELRGDLRHPHYAFGIAMHIGDPWRAEQELARLLPSVEQIAEFGTLARLLPMLQYLDLPQGDLLRFYRRFDQLATQWTRGLRLAADPGTREGRRIRIGYLSPDFKVHVMGLLMFEVISRHDRERFEIFLYSLNDKEDALTERFRAACDHFVRLDQPTSEDSARRIAGDRLDLLVDLGGHMAGSRPLILAYRPAAVQLTHLGYHGSLGLESVDFKITDRFADPPDNARFLIERLLPMNGCLMPFLRRTPAAATQSRADLGIADDRIVFGVFVNVLKLSPRCVAAWRAILERVDRAVLAFSPHYRWAREATIDCMARAGILREKLVFIPSGDERDFGRWRYQLVDIVLDTFPYTGGDTTVAALDMGVPVVTLRGERQSERVSYSILKNLGIDGTVAGSDAEYVDIACRLADDPGLRAAAAEQIRHGLERSNVSDMAAYARNLEQAFVDAIVLAPTRPG